jgi:hypothetical protein
MVKKTIFLAGGLGNQLFQLASALTSNRPHVKSFEFVNFSENMLSNFVDFSKIGVEARFREIRFWEIALVKMNLKFADYRRISKIVGCSLLFLSNILSFLTNGLIPCLVNDHNINRHNSRMRDRSNWYIGYFQGNNGLLDNNFMEALRRAKLRVNSSKLEKLVRDLHGGHSQVGIHIRLGDYLNEPDIGIVSQQYYSKCIQEIASRTKIGKIWVITQYGEEVALRFKFPQEYEFQILDSSLLSESESFTALGLFDFTIIANSSFSWWAAFLGNQCPSNIYYPYPWFANSYLISPNCMLEWVKTENPK